MKNVFFFIAFALFMGTTVKSQEEFKKDANKIIDKAKEGGFKLGAYIGVPLSGAGDVASFNIGGDVAYLFEVATNLEIGALVGYSYIFGNGDTYKENIDGVVVTKTFEDNSFVPISTTSRYYFNNRKFFGGLDLGYAINVSGKADSGFYLRPKFGFNLGAITLIGSYTGISGGVSTNNSNTAISVSGLNTFNVGAEIGF